LRTWELGVGSWELGVGSWELGVGSEALDPRLQHKLLIRVLLTESLVAAEAG
jgi:hypothetical protein